jgi:hypothetical protein
MAKLSKEAAAKFWKEAISTAIEQRNIELLGGLIRKPLPQEIRDHLADVIEGLLSKQISFPNRKPKQDLEDTRCELACRVRDVKKEKDWKLRAVVDFVAKEKRCSPSTVWSAWGQYGPSIVATEILREQYDLDALADNLMKAAREGRKKLTDEEMTALKNVFEVGSELQRGLRRSK